MLLSLPGCWHRTGTCTRAQQHSLGQSTVIPKGKQGPEESTCAGGAPVSHQGEVSEETTLRCSRGCPAKHRGCRLLVPGGLAVWADSLQQTDRQHAADRQPAAAADRKTDSHAAAAGTSRHRSAAALMQPAAAAPPLLAISLLLKVRF